MNGIASFRFSAGIGAVSYRVVAIAIIFLISLIDARAEVHVSGSKDAMTLQATNASLVDVLVAVELALGVKVNITPAVNIPVLGTYSGSLRSVLGRLLAGRNYILGSHGNQITIILPTVSGTIPSRRPLGINVSAPPRANVPIPDGDLNTTGVQGWSGGFSPKSPSAGKPK